MALNINMYETNRNKTNKQKISFKKYTHVEAKKTKNALACKNL
jgi:hypothetical protein